MSHFKGCDPLTHVLEKKAEGGAAFQELHEEQTPSHLLSATHAVRETSAVCFFLWLLLLFCKVPLGNIGPALLGFSLGWLSWKTGRSAWVGWSRLEHLHRLIAQERHEIQNHRDQEKEELIALYKEKGLEGELLEKVVSVLMEDEDRLLKVMLEEELGLNLQAYPHPLKLGLSTALGTSLALATSLLFFYLSPLYGMLCASPLLLAGAAVTSALYEKNRIIPEVIWNIAIAGLAMGITYFILSIL